MYSVYSRVLPVFPVIPCITGIPVYYRYSRYSRVFRVFRVFSVPRYSRVFRVFRVFPYIRGVTPYSPVFRVFPCVPRPARPLSPEGHSEPARCSRVVGTGVVYPMVIPHTPLGGYGVCPGGTPPPYPTTLEQLAGSERPVSAQERASGLNGLAGKRAGPGTGPGCTRAFLYLRSFRPGIPDRLRAIRGKCWIGSR